MFLINSFQDLCELQNRYNQAPVVYIVLNKEKKFYSSETKIHLFPNA